MAEKDHLGSRPGPDRDDLPELIKKLQERKARHKQRHPIHRAGVVVAGFLVVLVGIVLSGPGVPGPGFLVILIGLGMLALEFDRAERLLGRVIIWGDQAAERAQRTTTTERAILGTLAALVVIGFVASAVLWDIPLVPIL